METVYLIREPLGVSNTETLGIIIAKGKMFQCLELPWKDNQRNISCIPPGEYIVKFLPKSASGKYRNVWHIQDVENRGGVLIHTGNKSSHSRGCVLIGLTRGILSGVRAILSSRVALARFNSLMNKETFKIVVTYA